MKINSKNILCLALCGLISIACTDHLFEGSFGSGIPIALSGNIKQNNVTRASDYGFVTGDRMGIFIVDYENGNPGTLAASGNRASNVLYTFDGDKNAWNAPLEIYWRDNNTPVDVYGYYPGVNAISNPSSYRFEVSWQQNVLPQEGEISNYETSDLLWGKAGKVQPTTDRIVINYQHQLAGVCVTLKKGEGMTDIEWEKLGKAVQIDNTVRTCDFNLQTAAITITGNVDRSIQMLPQLKDCYRAVVVPQTVAAGKSLVSVTIDGNTYSHTLTDPMKYVGGKMHNFTLTVNKSAVTGDFSLVFTDGGISDWVNDETSHSFSQKQFVVVDCPEPKKLKESITAAGYDYKELKNLKVKGILTTEDFYFMRDEMSNLTHLNLHDVKIKHAMDDTEPFGVSDFWGELYYDDLIPLNAFYRNTTIRSLVLPANLKRIGNQAFSEMQLMYSTLEVPEGVTYLGPRAFRGNDYNGVELVLPYSLDSICSGALSGNSYSCELKMTDNLKYIGPFAFLHYQSDPESRMHGVFHLSSQLKEINEQSFESLGNDGSFTGDIEIPQGITKISDRAFSKIAFKNSINLTLPQGVKTIECGAFSGLRFASLTFNDDLEEILSHDDGSGMNKGAFYFAKIPFQITLPAKLRKIGQETFAGCGIEGDLIIPENCLDLGGYAFAGNKLTKITLPSKIEVIPEGFVYNNEFITTVTIPKYVSYIGKWAFSCSNLQTVVCLAEAPPNVQDGDPFIAVDKDKCVLEVPEKSVELYRKTPVWNAFKNITPHRELACNVPSITCMNNGVTREGVVRSEGAWEVAECPAWVTVSPSFSNNKKTEVKITVNSNSGETREGNIIFRLKNHEYNTYMEVKQVSGDVKEDQTITLQTAAAGAKAIPLFLVGEGYNADDIASGQYLSDMKEQMEHFFSIEPLKSYRDYFTVSTAIACSQESGIDGLRKFASDNWWEKESDLVLEYARKYGVGIKGNEGNSTILVLRNSNKTGDNKTDIYYDGNCGLAVSWMAKSDEPYPFNQQGFILHELAGTAFGKLGPEYFNHFTFMKACKCGKCKMSSEYAENRSHGWWQNVSNGNRLSELPWYHLIYDDKYSQYVDVYEGALNHSRGAYRSENVSVMGNQFIPYFNTISREILVRRIMEASGGKFDFATFKQNDKIETPK